MDGVESGRQGNGSSVLSSVLPRSIAQLQHLRYLDMSSTKQTCLPEEFCELHCLEELYLSRCSLNALPEDFGNLIKLKTLDISNNFLSQFPPSFQHLQSLVNLEMAWNELLVKFPALPKHLITLNARRCSNLQVISLMYDMVSLKTMDLSHCRNLTRLPPLYSWNSLKYINLDGCKQLVKLDSLPRGFASLRISGCSQLQKLSFGEGFIVATGAVSYNVRRVSIVEESNIGSGFILSSDQTQRLCAQRLCVVGCDNIQLNIYSLLQSLECLEQLDLSISPAQELLGEIQPLVGQKYRIVERDNSSVAFLFCFVFDRNGNVRIPEMEVVMTLNGGDHKRLFSRTFKIPSLMPEDCSGKNILRICVFKQKAFFAGGVMRCSYYVQDRLSERGSPVLLRQVEILPLSRYATSYKVTELLKQWKLLSHSKRQNKAGYTR